MICGYFPIGNLLGLQAKEVVLSCMNHLERSLLHSQHDHGRRIHCDPDTWHIRGRVPIATTRQIQAEVAVLYPTRQEQGHRIHCGPDTWQIRGRVPIAIIRQTQPEEAAVLYSTLYEQSLLSSSHDRSCQNLASAFYDTDSSQ